MADDPTTDPQPGTDPAPNPEPAKPEPKFTQEQLNSFLKSEKDKWAAKAEADRKAAEDKAKEDALKEQGEFKTLADQRAARITELEAETGQVESLTQERDAALAVVTGFVEQELKDAPDYVRDAIADKSPVDQFAYISKHRDKWMKPRPTGAGPTPQPVTTGPQTRDDIKNKYLKQAGRI